MRLRRKKERLAFREVAPHMVTSGNLLCGMLSVILLFHGRPLQAAWLIFLAVLFDALDGRVARRFGGGSQFGIEFDSLADVISFGAAPALLVYFLYLRNGGVPGAMAALFFTLCGALRLARFNVVHVPGPFQGLPIPAGGLFLASLVLAGIPLSPPAAGIVCAGAGGLMISSIPYTSLKGLDKRRKNRKKILLSGLAFFFTFFFLRSSAPLAFISLYILSGLVGFDGEKWLSELPVQEDAPAEDR